MSQPPRVFISYSHDNTEHQAFVLELADRLRQEQGIECLIDQHFLPGFPPQGWTKWMRDSVRDAKHVLMVCTPKYRDRYERNLENLEDTGHGVAFEGMVISQTLYEDYFHNNGLKFIPVLPSSGKRENVPRELRDFSIYTLPDAFQQVCDLIRGIKYNPPPPLGNPPVRDTLETVETKQALDERHSIAVTKSAALLAAENVYLEALLHDNEERSLRFAGKVYAPLAGQFRKERKRVATACMSPRLLHRKRTEYVEPQEMLGDCIEHADVIAAFNQHKRLVILGEPGAGKTFSLWRIAADYAQKALEQPGQTLPIVIPLNRWDKAGFSLHEFVLEQLGNLANHFVELHQSKRLLPLFDALNEIPFDQREEKLPQVRAWLERYPTPTVLLTCRLRDYRGPLEQDLDRLTIEPLDPPRIHDFLHNYFAEDDAEHQMADSLFWQLAGGEAMRSEWEDWKRFGYRHEWEFFWTFKDIPQEWYWSVLKKLGETWQDYYRKQYLRDPRSLMKLAANPYLLTQMVVIYSEQQQLPQSRFALFSEFVADLIYREMQAKPENHYPKAHEAELQAELKKLAWQLQSHTGSLEEARTTLPRNEAERTMPLARLEFAAAASLLELTRDNVRFSHQLLQEFFTAQCFGERCAAGLQASELWKPERWWEANGWEEAAKLAAEYEADLKPFLQWLAAGQPKLAAEIAWEQGLLDDMLFAVFRSQWQAAITDTENHPNPHERHALSTVLAWLDWDNRPGIGLDANGLPDIEWVEIPSGAFIYQNGEARTLPTFKMSRYPVTNAQFQAFVADGGYETEEWWDGLEKPEIIHESCWKESNRPVDQMDWNDAMAFCRWLSHKMQLDICLPTEEQWEKASRGTDGRQYPWGNEFESERINTEYTLGETSAVGIYPQGQSSFGLLEMAGNVWEWCRNKYDTREDVESDLSGDWRVSRGGSWDNGDRYVRCAFRNWVHPNGGDPTGFRVVLEL